MLIFLFFLIEFLKMKKNSSLSKNVNDKDSLKRDQIIQDYLKLNENANQSPEKYIDQDNMSISKNKKILPDNNESSKHMFFIMMIRMEV